LGTNTTLAPALLTFERAFFAKYKSIVSAIILILNTLAFLESAAIYGAIGT
jgi:hypothetical protein